MDVLKKIGLTAYEIKIYETLIQIGRSNANKISEQSKVPPTAVYPNLKSLILKQLVQKIKGDPSLFSALPPAIGIKKLVLRKNEDLSHTEGVAISYLKNLSKIKNESNKKEIVTLSYGKPISASIYFDACKRAKQSYYILGWKLKKISDKYMFLKALKKMIKKRVDVRIILTGDKEKNFELIKDYKEEGVLIKYLPLENFSIFIMDSSECKITLKDKNLDERYNIQILDKSLAKTMNDYFLEKWKESEEI